MSSVGGPLASYHRSTTPTRRQSQYRQPMIAPWENVPESRSRGVSPYRSRTPPPMSGYYSDGSGVPAYGYGRQKKPGFFSRFSRKNKRAVTPPPGYRPPSPSPVVVDPSTPYQPPAVQHIDPTTGAAIVDPTPAALMPVPGIDQATAQAPVVVTPTTPRGVPYTNELQPTYAAHAMQQDPQLYAAQLEQQQYAMAQQNSPNLQQYALVQQQAQPQVSPAPAVGYEQYQVPYQLQTGGYPEQYGMATGAGYGVVYA
eukprot:TRINITY_DN84659_c0_g1_i1.p1 TRINITY_DN84659_c0_g1~~TRINITY_DN84659_c0_g1_i1.p1  ORF type:complete len:255 (-),score=29.37 TRINITY_DN84659_c0_g1_i1:194-958(-)